MLHPLNSASPVATSDVEIQDELKPAHEHDFCAPCLQVLAHYTTRRSLVPRHQTPKLSDYESPLIEHYLCGKEFRVAVEAGCVLCARIWHHFIKAPWWSDYDINECRPFTSARWCKRTNPSERSPSSQDYLEITLHGGELPSQLKTSFALHEEQRGTDKSWMQARTIESEDERTRLQATADRLRRWLDVCDGEHECPVPARVSKYTAQRLLYIEGDIVRLVEHSNEYGVRDHLAYATLSHRWGASDNFLRLTPETYAKFAKGLPIRDLPRTFRDSVLLCSKLQLPRIWIDSLCIIQDGSEHVTDWNRHVNEMASIYANAYVNIAASVADDCSRGLFKTRSPGFQAPIALSGNANSLQLIHSHSEASDDWIINSRAWVFQERLLSPRIVHFGETDVYFECSEHVVSCNYPHGVLDAKQRTSPWAVFNWQMAPNETVMGWREGRWFDLSEGYSRCQLTRFQDRLPALAGIARQFNELYIRSQYLAGLYELHLPRALLWSRGDRDVQPPSKNESFTYGHDFVAPTWSWVSYPRGISFMYCFEIEQEAAILDAVVDLVDVNNPYGMLRSASLVLEAWVADLVCDGEHQLENGSFVWQTLMIVGLEGEKREQAFTIYWDHKLEPEDHRVSFQLVIIVIETHYKGSDSWKGLVIKPRGSDHGSHQTFLRVGMFYATESRPRPEVIAGAPMVFTKHKFTLA